jgi:hypothetical protein
MILSFTSNASHQPHRWTKTKRTLQGAETRILGVEIRLRVEIVPSLGDSGMKLGELSDRG